MVAKSLIRKAPIVASSWLSWMSMLMMWAGCMSSFSLVSKSTKQSIFSSWSYVYGKKKNQQMKQAFFILRKINNIRCWWFQTVFHSGYITDLTNHNLWILRVIQWNESSYMYLSQHMLFISTSAWCTHVLEMIILVIKFHTCIYIYILIEKRNMKLRKWIIITKKCLLYKRVNHFSYDDCTCIMFSYPL